MAVGQKLPGTQPKKKCSRRKNEDPKLLGFSLSLDFFFLKSHGFLPV